MHIAGAVRSPFDFPQDERTAQDQAHAHTNRRLDAREDERTAQAHTNRRLGARDSRLRGNDGLGAFVRPSISLRTNGQRKTKPMPILIDGLGARDSRLRGNDGLGAFVRPSISLRTNGRSKPQGKRGCWCAGGRTDSLGPGYATVFVRGNNRIGHWERGFHDTLRSHYGVHAMVSGGGYAGRAP